MTLTWPKPNRQLGFVDVLGLTGLLGLFAAKFRLFLLVPFWNCPIRSYTGWPCPGCGLTRVADYFSHGQFKLALIANPLGTLAASGFVLAVIAGLAHLVFKFPIPAVYLSHREARILRTVVICALALNYGFVIAQTRLHLFNVAPKQFKGCTRAADIRSAHSTSPSG